MGKFIFRRIGGRVVPIIVERNIVKTGIAGPKSVTYHLRKGAERVGEFWGFETGQRAHRFLVGAHLNPEYRAQGLGKEFYGKLAASIRKLGGKTMVGNTDNVAVVKKVRELVGKTRIFKSPKFSGTGMITTIAKRKK